MSAPGAGTGGKGGGMEVFPDLHHKMSKKIAQLTKVIYHLNTKNEDHALEIEQLNFSHQMEVQQILRDAANRISKFKDAIEAKQQSVTHHFTPYYLTIYSFITSKLILQATQAKDLEKLQRKHEQEKSQAQQDLISLRTSFSERETKIAQEFTTKYELLQKEVVSMNSRFGEKISTFESINSELRRSLEDSSRTGSTELDSLRSKHERELADIIRASNDKFNQMLIEQLSLQENLKIDFESRLSTEKRLLTEKHILDLDRETGQLRAKLSAEKTEALIALRHETEEKMSTQKNDFLLKIEKLLQELRLKTEEFDKLKEQSDVMIRSLMDKVTLLTQGMDDIKGGSAAQQHALNTQLLSLQDHISTLQQTISTRDEEIMNKTQLLNSKNELFQKLSSDYSTAQNTIISLQTELENVKQATKVEISTLQVQILELQKEGKKKENEINSLQNNINYLTEELKKSHEKSGFSTQQLEAKISSLELDKTLLQTQVSDLQNRLNSESSFLNEKVTFLQSKVEQQQVDFSTEKERLASQHHVEKTLILEKNNQEIGSLQQAMKLQKDGFELQISTLNLDITQQKSTFTTRLQTQENEFHEKFVLQSQAYETDKENLKTQIIELETQILGLQESSTGEKTQLKAEFTKLEAKYKTMQKEYELKKIDFERVEQVTTSLKNQIENLREELKASQKAYREKLDISTAKLIAEWQSRLDTEIARLEQEKISLQSQLTATYDTNTRQLQSQHAEEIASLKSLLQKEAGDSAITLAQLERQREALEVALSSEKASKIQQITDLQTLHSTTTKATEERHNQELERLRREFKSLTEQKESLLTQTHSLEVERLTRLLAATKQEAEEDKARTIQHEQSNAELNLRKQLQEQEMRLLDTQKAALQTQLEAFGREKDGINDRHASVKQQLEAELTGSKQQTFDANNQITTLQKMIAEERQARHQREEQFILDRDQLLRNNEMDLRKEKQNTERQLLQQSERHALDTNILQQETQTVRTQYEERLREIAKEYKILEERYLKRESRPEDIQRIQQLEREMIEKDDLVARTKEEMLYFKREMLNREENYNQKFNRQPNVGVMQVIKQKEAPPVDGRAKPTSMRVISNPNGMSMPGAANMGMGMGIGMTVGSGSAPSGSNTGAGVNGASTKSSRSIK